MCWFAAAAAAAVAAVEAAAAFWPAAYIPNNIPACCSVTIHMAQLLVALNVTCICCYLCAAAAEGLECQLPTLYTTLYSTTISKSSLPCASIQEQQQHREQQQ
jgi:hypothetical protein